MFGIRVRIVGSGDVDVTPHQAARKSWRKCGKEGCYTIRVICGIPFVVKDNIASKDKMETAAGSAVPICRYGRADRCARPLPFSSRGWRAPWERPICQNRRLCERVTMPKLYSFRGGQNRNPYNLAHHPGASSFGSASTLASNMCAFSIGTKIDGSAMFPADRNAVVGIKPTVGHTSTLGVIPELPSMDTVGTFGRSVATIILDIIAEG